MKILLFAILVVTGAPAPVAAGRGIETQAAGLTRDEVTSSARPAAPGDEEPAHRIEVFGRPGCPYCVRAEAFLDALDARRPDVAVIHYNVLEDPVARERLRTLATAAGYDRVAVPAIHVHGELIIGFDQPETTGRRIEALLDRVPAPPPDAAGEVTLPLFGTVRPGDLGLPLFTVIIGLVDGFNPCAMWVLLFLLSLLVNLKSRARMAVIGGTFVVVSGVVYYAFMAAWLSFFLLVGLSRGMQVILGLMALAAGAVHVKDFFAFQRGFSLSIPASAKPGIYARVRRIIQAENLSGALVTVIVLAAMVNMVELLCTAGLPALYTQVLASHDLPGWQHYLYLLLYIVAYMFDDALMLTIAVVTLGRRKLQERGGRWLKLLSGAVMALLGLLLLFAPGWLSWS